MQSSSYKGRVTCASLLLCVLSISNVEAQIDGVCMDHRPDCVSLARVGYCMSNSKEMFKACPLTCLFCQPPPKTHNALLSNEISCFDRDVNCRSFALSGLCRSHSQQMEKMCSLSCNFCRKSPEVQRTIANPDFDCGRPYPRPSNRRTRQVPRPTQIGGANTSQGNTGISAPTSRNIKVSDTICGATVISSRYLVTAAHCVLDPARPVRLVRLGELDFSRQDEANSRPADYEIQKIIVHPDFNPNMVERYNDIALLETVIPIEFNDVVFPMCVTGTKPPEKTLVTAAGFGKVNATSQASVLQEGDLSTISNSDCESAYRQNQMEPLLKGWYPSLLQGRDVLCAGHPGRGTCKDDAGGPLFHQSHNGRRYLVGISSLGLACRGSSYAELPGVYVSVADHIDFIDSVLYGF